MHKAGAMMAAAEMFRIRFEAGMLAGKKDTGELMLYGEIIQDMPAAWKWSQEDKSAAELKRAVEKLREEGAAKLLVRINSPGGIVSEAVAMRSVIAGAGFESITFRIEGMCASAATLIAAIGGAHVEIAEGSEYMIHNPWSAAWGCAEDLEKAAGNLRNLEKMARGIYMARTGKDEETVKAWMDAETWFTAQEAVENGFADTVLEAKAAGMAPAAACVSKREMEAMKAIYRGVPGHITVREDPGAGNANPPEAAVSAEKEKEGSMEISEITMEQLREGNPALLEQARAEAVAAERERISDIDALTMPGYEDLAERAKAEGMSAMDFQKAIVAARKKKGAEFLESRKAETAPAKNIAGGAPDDGKDEEAEIRNIGREIAGYAEGYDTRAGGMF